MDSITTCVLFALALLAVPLLRKRPPLAPLPPGPPSEPILGHARVFPATRLADAFKDLGDKYGDILYFNVFGQKMVVLNHYGDAVNLLDKRNAIYSDRPDCTTFNLMGFGILSSLLRYGPTWRNHRRMLQEKLLPRSCLAYHDILHREVKALLRRLNGLKGSCSPAIIRFLITVPIEIAYGHRITSDDDEYLVFTQEAVNGIEAGGAGTTFLDLFPFLQYIPHWLPGCSWITEVPRKWRPVADKLMNYPFEVVLQEMRSGTARPSYVSDWLALKEQQGSATQEDMDAIRGSAVVLFMGGYDTTRSTLETFILFMLLFPDVQRKAQEEIDRVVGFAPSRLPDFEDRPELPYLDCILREVLRWNPVFLTGVPHRVLQDDIYKGMLIPKGSIVVANAKGMSRDERLYRDPERFYPERFLPEPQGWGEKDHGIAFGFGRRICPGRHLADLTLWLVAANILAAFNITNSIGEDGSKIIPELSFADGFVSHPEDFECLMTPRSAQMASLVVAV